MMEGTQMGKGGRGEDYLGESGDEIGLLELQTGGQTNVSF
jgi:hypothetical protein